MEACSSQSGSQGFGPKRNQYGNHTLATRVIRNSPSYQHALQNYLFKNSQYAFQDESFNYYGVYGPTTGASTNYSDWFTDPLMAMTGQYKIDFRSAGDGQIFVTATNTTGMTSFMHGFGFTGENEWPGSPRGEGFLHLPFSDVQQRYIWTEQAPK